MVSVELDTLSCPNVAVRCLLKDRPSTCVKSRTLGLMLFSANVQLKYFWKNTSYLIDKTNFLIKVNRKKERKS